MISCQNDLKFSTDRAARRQKIAQALLGRAVNARIIGFALFLLGANRQIIASVVGMSFNTFLSFLTRVNEIGVDGFRDRRRRAIRVSPSPPALQVQVTCNNGAVQLAFGDKKLVLPEENPIRKRVVLLTLADNGFLDTGQLAELLNCSQPHALVLRQKLASNDVTGIIDKRSGQLSDYRVHTSVKSDIILHWAANAAAGRKTSGDALALELYDEKGRQLSPRTVRHHLRKLGLTGAHHRFNSLIDSIKKTSDSHR